MDDLARLFHICAYDIHYEEAGDSVNYAFDEVGSTLYIYFQGSNSARDWIENFWFFPIGKKPYKKMDVSYRVHRGFLRCWKQVEDIVKQKILEKETWGEWAYRWKEIIVVGYSHGAALAGFCQELVWFYRPDLRNGKLRGYGFESPRFFSAWHVKKRLRERWEHFQVVRTNGDLVTHLPPVLFRFCHVGHMLKAKGDVSLCPNPNVPNCIKSHYPEVVYDALKNLD